MCWFLLLLAPFIVPCFSVDCIKGRDYFGTGDCIEPNPTLLDRLSAERFCRKNGGILYYPYNSYVTSQFRIIASDYFPGQPSVWIGITCSNKTTCYNDRGGKLIVTNPINYTNFIEDVKQPCAYYDVSSSKGLWFGDACRGDHKRPSICWYTGSKTDPTCMPGQFYYNGRCYGLHGTADAIVASDHCHDEGGELVSIHSSIQNDYIFDLTVATVSNLGTYGIGMYVDSDGNVRWFDNSPVDYNNFGVPADPPPAGTHYPPPNSTIYVDATRWWYADVDRKPILQVCSWPPCASDFSKQLHTYPNYCQTGKLPLAAIIYSPNYSDYSYGQGCTLTYSSGVPGETIQIIFNELYLGLNSEIWIYDNPENRISFVITYNSDPREIYTSSTGYMKVQMSAPKGDYNYWSATTIPQGGRVIPLQFPKPALCDPSKTLTLRTSTSSQFQTMNYGSGGMNYPCLITISGNSATSTVAVSFYDFYLSEEDEFIIIDGDLTSPVTERKLSGRQPATRIESTGQHLSFRITSVAPGYRGIWADFVSN